MVVLSMFPRLTLPSPLSVSGLAAKSVRVYLAKVVRSDSPYHSLAGTYITFSATY